MPDDDEAMKKVFGLPDKTLLECNQTSGGNCVQAKVTARDNSIYDTEWEVDRWKKVSGEWVYETTISGSGLNGSTYQLLTTVSTAGEYRYGVWVYNDFGENGWLPGEPDEETWAFAGTTNSLVLSP
jgi:hypothetical protein